MSNKIKYDDIFAFHPGYYISELIDDMCISQAEFAARMGTTAKTLSKLLNGQCRLSDDLALKIATMLGSSVDVWLNLQKTYDEKVLEIEHRKSINAQITIMKKMDYSYFEKIAKLPAAQNVTDKIANLCKCLMVSDLRILQHHDFLVNYRTAISNVQEKNIINSRAWIQIALNQAKNMKVSPFDAEKLKGYLPEIRKMTIQNPDIFLPRLRKIFSECGVAFVLLPHLKNSAINGAVKWYGHSQVVLAVNDRRLYADTFWFSLFHEIKHVLQQKVKTVFVSGNEDIADIEKSLEEEADVFAQNYLIPKNEYKNLISSRYIPDSKIITFANYIGVDPGVVVGRLQHDRHIPQNRCSKLKKRYKIVIK